MKFEQINDKQIKCTLNPEDFQNMHVDLRDLAYGNEKTRRFFHSLVEQACEELNFEIEDGPLMIEAIPLAENSISLLITKVDDPEELDTRFSRFFGTPTEEEDEEAPFTDTLRNLFENIFSAEETPHETTDAKAETVSQTLKDSRQRLFRFDDLDAIGEAARALSISFTGRSSVYKDEPRRQYLLILQQDEASAEEFSSICNQLTEYSTSSRDQFMVTYYMEHCEPLIQDHALSILKNL